MGKVNPTALVDWQDGQTVSATDYKRERDLVVTANNDTHDRYLADEATLQIELARLEGFSDKGVYDPLVSYTENSFVSYENGLWRALQTTLGNIPIEGLYWTSLLSVKQPVINAETATTNANSAATTTNQIGTDVQLAEDIRLTSETTRVSNEFTRQTDEGTRVSNEATRETNETARLGEETTRQSNETSRVSAENTRGTNESSRVTAETARVGSEDSRVLAESNRVTVESGRVIAEGTRVSSEDTRIVNESTRQSQEATRQTDTSTAITNTNAAASNANTQGGFALTWGNYAQEKGDEALQVANDYTVIPKIPVATFTSISTTYPTPLKNWLVQTEDDGKFYRYDGSGWVYHSKLSTTQITAIQTQLSLQDQQTSILTHGLSVINSDLPSPMKVEFYGNTLVNLLGRIGNCDDASKWSSEVAGGLTSDPALGYYGTNGFKFVRADITVRTLYKSDMFELNKYYIVAVTAKSNVPTSSMLLSGWFGGSPAGTGSIYNFHSLSTTWKTYYLKLNPLDFPTTNRLAVGIREGASTDELHIDGIRLIEIDQATYDKIGVSLLDADVERMFPYVDSVKSVVNPVAMVEGTNLFDKNNAIAGKYVAYTSGALFDNVGFYATEYINVVGSTNYSPTGFKNSTGTSGLAFYDKDKNYISGLNGSSATSPFTTPSNAYYLRHTIDTNEYSLDVVQLELGNTSSPVVPYNPSYLYAETTLAGNDNEKDILSYNEGTNQWEKIKKFEANKAMDGSLPWLYSANCVGFKRVAISAGITPLGVSGSQIVTKYNGSILKKVVQWDDVNLVLFNGSSFEITISDTDTGFLETLSLTTELIKSYFYGWKVNSYTVGTNVVDEATGLLASAGTYTVLNTTNIRNVVVEKSTDNVAWSSAVLGTDYALSLNYATLTNATAGGLYFRIDYNYGATVNGWGSLVDGSVPATNTLTYVSTTMATGFTPYELTYQLVTPVIEPVNVEGDLSIQGDAQVEIGEGVIVREEVTSILSNGYYYFNRTDGGASNLLKHRTNKMIEVYKNGTIDKKWSFVTSSVGNGGMYAQIKEADFGTTATYTVTYSVLDKYDFTTNLTEVIVNYSNSLKSAFQSTVSRQSDIMTGQSILDRQMLNVLIRLDAGGL